VNPTLPMATLGELHIGEFYISPLIFVSCVSKNLKASCAKSCAILCHLW
jgi:hypothetical protein